MSVPVPVRVEHELDAALNASHLLCCLDFLHESASDFVLASLHYSLNQFKHKFARVSNSILLLPNYNTYYLSELLDVWRLRMLLWLLLRFLLHQSLLSLFKVPSLCLCKPRLLINFTLELLLASGFLLIASAILAPLTTPKVHVNSQWDNLLLSDEVCAPFMAAAAAHLYMHLYATRNESKSAMMTVALCLNCMDNLDTVVADASLVLQAPELGTAARALDLFLRLSAAHDLLLDDWWQSDHARRYLHLTCDYFVLISFCGFNGAARISAHLLLERLISVMISRVIMISCGLCAKEAVKEVFDLLVLRGSRFVVFVVALVIIAVRFLLFLLLGGVLAWAERIQDDLGTALDWLLLGLFGCCRCCDSRLADKSAGLLRCLESENLLGVHFWSEVVELNGKLFL